MPADEVNATEPPWQNVVGPEGVIFTIGNGLTVTVVSADEAEHPLTSVIVTEYEPDVLTVIDWVVSPVLHR